MAPHALSPRHKRAVFSPPACQLKTNSAARGRSASSASFFWSPFAAPAPPLSGDIFVFDRAHAIKTFDVCLPMCTRAEEEKDGLFIKWHQSRLRKGAKNSKEKLSRPSRNVTVHTERKSKNILRGKYIEKRTQIQSIIRYPESYSWWNFVYSWWYTE